MHGSSLEHTHLRLLTLHCLYHQVNVDQLFIILSSCLTLTPHHTTHVRRNHVYTLAHIFIKITNTTLIHHHLSFSHTHTLSRLSLTPPQNGINVPQPSHRGSSPRNYTCGIPRLGSDSQYRPPRAYLSPSFRVVPDYHSDWMLIRIVVDDRGGFDDSWIDGLVGISGKACYDPDEVGSGTRTE